MKTLYFGAVILISGLYIAAAAGPTVAEYHEKAQPPKLDINKATQRDIAIKINPILGKDVCHAITGDRREGGPYKSLEELVRVQKITKADVEKLRDTVCVDC